MEPRRARRDRRLPGAARPSRYDIGGAPWSCGPSFPDGLLPVFVLDRYQGLEARLLQDFTRAERARYVEANVGALRELAAGGSRLHEPRADGRRRSARRLGAPFRVKAHGSELEYSMRGRPGAPGVGARVARAAEATYVGSRAHPRGAGGGRRPRRPRRRGAARASTSTSSCRRRAAEALARRCSTRPGRDPPNPGNAKERLPDEGNAERLAAFLAGDEPTVVYFGKLIRNKGVHLLLEALRRRSTRAP